MSSEEKLKRCDDAFNVFKRNIQLVEKFTLIAKAREVRMTLRDLRPLASLREKAGRFRKFLKDLNSVGLPMVLVFAVICYETFLKEMYKILKGDELTRKENRAFFKPKAVTNLFGKIIKSDPLKGDAKLLKDVRIVIIKRNVIIHKAGENDKTAEDEFRSLGVIRYKKGKKLELEADEVENDAQKLKCYATKIFESVNSYLSLLG